jgi:Glycosyl Hydrolase Family 88
MVPPFLAYLSVSTGNIDYLHTALAQIQKYRDELRINEGQHAGQWRHIIGPQNQDEGAWASGCGWAAMGIARVLATIMKWKTTADWEDEQAQLKGYILELLDGALTSPRDPTNRLLRNYLNDETYSGEAAGTALLAATAYRMAVLVPDEFGPNGIGGKYLAWADESRSVVERCIDENGLVAPVVNPLRHRQREPLHGGSPEGQCFVALMLAAYNDYIASKL